MPTTVISAELANAVRLGNAPPAYEVWFYLITLQDAEKALWCRHTLYRPKQGKPFAQLQALWFDANDTSQNQLFECNYPLSSYRTSGKFFFVQTGKSWLRQNAAWGEIELPDGQSIQWDLEFEAPDQEVWLLPPWMRRGPIPASQFCTPHPEMLVRGKVRVNEQWHKLEDEPGMQGHVWGRALADNWIWAHGNLFPEEPQASLEILAGQARVAGILAPTLKPVFIRYQGHDYILNTLQQLLSNQVKPTGPWAWELQAEGPEIRLRGQFWAQPEDLLYVPYPCPTGKVRHCYSTLLGSAHLQVETLSHGQWISQKLTTDRACGLEWVGKQRN